MSGRSVMTDVGCASCADARHSLRARLGVDTCTTTVCLFPARFTFVYAVNSTSPHCHAPLWRVMFVVNELWWRSAGRLMPPPFALSLCHLFGHACLFAVLLALAWLLCSTWYGLDVMYVCSPGCRSRAGGGP
jgi:hypothetical protein